MDKYIMALDQGTTSSRCIIFDRNGRIAAKAQKEFTQYFPAAGWVEHDPMAILASEFHALEEAFERSGLSPTDIAGIGITNQRETTIVWDRKTGQPIYNAIVWQCRRTTDICRRPEIKDSDRRITEITGLKVDPYFSATKMLWLKENVEGLGSRADSGEVLFATVDGFLVYNLTSGKSFASDYSNCSRTMLFDIHRLCWDDELLEYFRIPRSMLPQVRPSSCIYGETDPEFFGGQIPISGIAGDQQAALFGQTCYAPGEAKNTYGTGCFLLMNIGEKPIYPANGLLTTIAWGLDGKVEYALEGSVFVAGAAIQWLRDELKIIDQSPDSEYFATRVEDTNGCYVVPAFTGLGAPYWDPYARGAITGLTRGVNKYHIIRATLESLAFQTGDVLAAMEEGSGVKLSSLKVDGGACRNDFLMQFQADLIDTPVQRPDCVETTAMGASYLAGLAVGFWQGKEDVIRNWSLDREFAPAMDAETRSRELRGWQQAVNSTRGWAKE